jgi:translation initiation factor IF-1
MTDSEKALELEGTIMSVLPGTMFRVALANDHLVLAHISGKMRKRFIRLTVGDRVRMQMSPYDTAKARIVYRLWHGKAILFRSAATATETEERRRSEKLAGTVPLHFETHWYGSHDWTETLAGRKTRATKIYLRALWCCP